MECFIGFVENKDIFRGIILVFEKWVKWGIIYKWWVEKGIMGWWCVVCW